MITARGDSAGPGAQDRPFMVLGVKLLNTRHVGIKPQPVLASHPQPVLHQARDAVGAGRSDGKRALFTAAVIRAGAAGRSRKQCGRPDLDQTASAALRPAAAPDQPLLIRPPEMNGTGV